MCISVKVKLSKLEMSILQIDTAHMLNGYEYFILFVLCIVNDLQILTIPTNSHFCYYVFQT
jgi:hypothetical protein